MTRPTIEYTPSPDREVRIRSALTIIEAILPLEVEPSHKRELLSVCIWKITEADGKWNTRYRSEAARRISGSSGLCHEHVFTRKSLVDRLIRGDSVRGVLENCIACVVTNEERKVLDRVPEAFEGWDRYSHVGIPVWDLQARSWKVAPDGFQVSR